MKRTLVFITILILCISSFGTAFASSDPGAVATDMKMAANGKTLVFERPLYVLNGRVLSPVRTTFECFNAKVDWYEEKNEIIISKDDISIRMTIGSTRAEVNGEEKISDTPPILVRGTVMVPVGFLCGILGVEAVWDGGSKTVYLGQRPQNQGISRGDGSKFVVAIDAGHGGYDPGASHGGIKEKDLNLDIAIRLNTLLQDQGITTVMTRTTDKFVELKTRAAIANRANADLFISIHNNAGMAATSGTMTLYYPSLSKNFNGRNLADIVQKELVDKLNTRNIGTISRPNLVVLRETRMPAVIAEIGYMTNEKELAKLKTESFRRDAAEALKEAVIKALKKL